MTVIKQRRSLHLVGASAVVAAVAVVGVSVAVAGRNHQAVQSAPTFSAKSKKVALRSKAQRWLARAGYEEVHLLGVRGDRAFYRVIRTDGRTCFGVGFRSDVGNPGQITCFVETPAVMDFSVVEIVRGSTIPRYLRMEGIAADGIAKVRAKDETNRVIAEAPVAGNLYQFKLNPSGVIRVVGVDTSGREIDTE
jgi:hypothetical protein